MIAEPGTGQRRGHPITRAILILIAIVILLPLAAVAVFVARFDPNSYKPEITAVAERAIGRKLILSGPLSLGLSLVPTIQATNVALANPPGFSQPEMARLARLDAQVALLPLISGRLEVRNLVLVRPDVRLEINRAGASNWTLARPASTSAGAPAGAAAPQPPAPAVAKPVAIEIGALRIEDGSLSWQDDRSGRHGVLLLRSLSMTSGGPGTPLAIAANADYDGIPIRLKGEGGPLSRLVAPGVGPAWPVDLALASGAARLTLQGSLADPGSLRGYRLRLAANVPALETFAPFVPGLRLPALHGVVLSAELSDAGSGRPEPSDLKLEVSESGLAAIWPGLRLASLSLVAPGLDQPCKLALAGSLTGTPFQLEATLGAPAALLPAGLAPPPPAKPWPVAMRITAAGADLSLSGTLARPVALSGANLAVSAEIPDLARLSPLAGLALPRLSQIAFSAKVADAESGWRQWVRLSALSLGLPEGELGGDATVSLAGARPAIRAVLTSKELDIDRLRAAVAPAAASQHPGPAPAVSPGAAAAHPQRLIPDTPLPLSVLRRIDAEVTFAVGRVALDRASYTGVTGRLSLADGKLVLAPFSANTPAGHVMLSASVDAKAATPPVALTLNAPALALAPLLASFGLPAGGSGTVAVRAEFSGAGHTPHAIAAGLNGRLGVAMAGGSLDNRVLADLLGPVLRAGRVPPELFVNGRSEVRCLAVRIDAERGVGTLRAGLLDIGGIALIGDGSLSLGPETLALLMVPTFHYQNNSLSLPVRVGGTFLAPKVAPVAAGAARSAAGVLGNLIRPRGEFGRFLEALQGNREPAVPDCAPALALARFGESGPPAPPPRAPPRPSGSSTAKAPSPLNLLRGLFH